MEEQRNNIYVVKREEREKGERGVEDEVSGRELGEEERRGRKE